ncbi:MAG: hypothetical protein IPK19_27145 [Chloroflexi bacterium]|nr:hypothetical protein [Chloroflexota bacterium]
MYLFLGLFSLILGMVYMFSRTGAEQVTRYMYKVAQRGEPPFMKDSFESSLGWFFLAAGGLYLYAQTIR